MDKNFFQKDLTLGRDVSRDVCRAEASVILFPLRKLRSNRITDIILTAAQRLSSSIPLTLHSGPQTLVAPEQSGIRSAHVSYHDPLLVRQVLLSSVFAPLMILLPTQLTSFASHPNPAVFAPLTRHPGNETTPRAGTATINKKSIYHHASPKPQNPGPGAVHSRPPPFPFRAPLRSALNRGRP